MRKHALLLFVNLVTVLGSTCALPVRQSALDTTPSAFDLASRSHTVHSKLTFQGVGSPPRIFLATPSRTWLVDDWLGELVVVEPETGFVVHRFTLPGALMQIAASPDGRQLVGVAWLREPRAGETMWLLSWDLLLGQEIFRRRLPVPISRSGGLLIAPREILAADCQPNYPTKIVCGFHRFDRATGATLVSPPSAAGKKESLFDPNWTAWPGSSQYSPDGKHVVVSNQSGGAILYSVDPPALVTTLPGSCAAFDPAGNVVWVPGDPWTISLVEHALRAVGLSLRRVSGCPPTGGVHFASRGGQFEVEVTTNREEKDYYLRYRAESVRILNRATGRTAVIPAYTHYSATSLYLEAIGVNHDLVWSFNTSEKTRSVYLQRAAKIELPLLLPGGDEGHRIEPDGTIHWGQAGQLHALRASDMTELPAWPLSLPGGQPWGIERGSPALPTGELVLHSGHGEGHFLVTPPPTLTARRIPWVPIDDNTTNLSLAGDRYLLVGHIRQGILVIDLKTGRRAGTLCRYDQDRCSDAVPSADGRTATILVGGSGGKPDRIEQVAIPSGTLLSSRPIPKRFWSSFGNFTLFQNRMGWIEPNRRLWLVGGDEYANQSCEVNLHSLCILTILDLTVDPIGVSVVRPPAGPRFIAAPDHAFFAQPTAATSGVSVFRIDGAAFLTFGTFRDGRYAYTQDGRFACVGEGCATLRCTVADQSQPLDHPACRALRREGFSIDQELAAPQMR